MRYTVLRDLPALGWCAGDVIVHDPAAPVAYKLVRPIPDCEVTRTAISGACASLEPDARGARPPRPALTVWTNPSPPKAG